MQRGGSVDRVDDGPGCGFFAINGLIFFDKSAARPCFANIHESAIHPSTVQEVSTIHSQGNMPVSVHNKILPAPRTHRKNATRLLRFGSDGNWRLVVLRLGESTDDTFATGGGVESFVGVPGPSNREADGDGVRFRLNRIGNLEVFVLRERIPFVILCSRLIHITEFLFTERQTRNE